MALRFGSTKSSTGSATNIVATYTYPAGGAPAPGTGGVPASAPAAPAAGAPNNEQFGWVLYFAPYLLEKAPAAALAPGVPGPAVPAVGITGAKSVLQQLMGFNNPTSVREFVAFLADNERNELAKAFQHPSGSGSCNGDDGALVQVLEGSAALEKYLDGKKPRGSKTTYVPPAISTLINKPGLHLLLANPVVNAVVMAQRKAQTAAAMARPIVPAPSPFGLPIPGGLTIRLSGGALEELDPAYPIEMRGAGQSFAAMKGGTFPFVIGTTASPTSWRPISDNSFISASLTAALDSLKSTLQTKGASLAKGTDAAIDKLITDLKDAEEKVIKHRDALTDFNNAIASGSAKVNGQSINLGQVQTTADAYNQAMKMRQKLENKLFRVVVALGGKVVYP